jgi:DNA invertase Pin-like site-specific DNA recombinase
MTTICNTNGRDSQRVAIYGRVSTMEQNTDNQVNELQRYCEARMYAVHKVYVDKGVSGSKESRPEFDVMLDDAKKRKFDILLVWKLDRLSRSLKHLLNTLDTLNALGISFICYSDNIDTTTSTGRLMFQMVGAFAEFERSLIRERVKLGLKRAREEGKKLGRPRCSLCIESILKYVDQQYSLRRIAKTFNVSHNTIRNILKSEKAGMQ